MGRTKGSKNRRTPPECHPDRKHRAFGLCNACYKQQYRGRNLDRHKEQAKKYAQRRNETASWRDGWLKRKFGISSEEYDIMLEKQNGVCAICGGKTKRRLAVDHDHQTGKVRGLLCGACNPHLAWLENLEWRRKAEEYLGQ